MSFCVRRTFAALGYAAKSVFSFIWCEVARKGDVPCGVLLPITSCRLRAQAPNSQIRKRGRGKNLHVLGEQHDVQFLVPRAHSKISRVYCQKKTSWEHWHSGGPCGTVRVLRCSYFSVDCLLHRIYSDERCRYKRFNKSAVSAMVGGCAALT